MISGLGSLSPWLAPVVSSIGLVLSAVVLIELNEEKRRKHGPWLFVTVLLLAGASMGLSWIQIVQSDRETANLKSSNTTGQRTIQELQREIQILRGELGTNLVLHPKPQPPIKVISTFVEPALTAGASKTLHLTITNTTDAIVPVVLRYSATLVRLSEPFNEVTDKTERSFEDAIHGATEELPFTPEKDVATNNGGDFDVPLQTPPLSEDDIQRIGAGPAMIYYLLQVHNAETQRPLLEACIILTPTGDLKNCTHWNRDWR